MYFYQHYHHQVSIFYFYIPIYLKEVFFNTVNSSLLISYLKKNLYIINLLYCYICPYNDTRCKIWQPIVVETKRKIVTLLRQSIDIRNGRKYQPSVIVIPELSSEQNKFYRKTEKFEERNENYRNRCLYYSIRRCSSGNIYILI